LRSGEIPDLCARVQSEGSSVTRDKTPGGCKRPKKRTSPRHATHDLIRSLKQGVHQKNTDQRGNHTINGKPKGDLDKGYFFNEKKK